MNNDIYYYPREWQKCPICQGCGLVGGGFFDCPGNIDEYGNRTWVSGNAAETCRVCEGKGSITTPTNKGELKSNT
uniref:Uncharacterized protein n=1 Tax=viral metagenome TaxID=1070528 RepID=A0A6M3Y7U6_9ZZZZ